MRNSIISICSIAILLTFSLTSRSHAAQWGPVWDKLAEQPGAEVEDSMVNGKERRRIKLASGVDFVLQRNGNEVSYTGFDHSGHGGVMCAWGIYGSLRMFMDMCPTKTDDDLKIEIDGALDIIGDFIVENNRTPVTKAQLLSGLHKKMENEMKLLRGMSEEQSHKACFSSDARQMIEAMKRMPKERFRANIAKLLSVKRPPVMNPCL